MESLVLFLKLAVGHFLADYSLIDQFNLIYSHRELESKFRRFVA
jgi:hypothetical protein